MNDKDLERHDLFAEEESQSQSDDFFQPRLKQLPKEFHKTWAERIDRRYLGILIVSLILHVTMVTYFLLNPPPKERTLDRIAKIQKRLAQVVKRREKRVEEPIAKFEFPKEKKIKKPEVLTTQPSGGTPSKGKPAAPPPAISRTTGKGGKSRSGRRGFGGNAARTRAQITSAISSKGILALLSSTSDIAQGEAVEDILGPTELSSEDLDKTLAQLSQIEARGTPSRGKGGAGKGGGEVKGGRAGEAHGIDDLVEGLGTTKSSSFERSGEIVVESESPLIEGTSTKGIVGRNPDDLQAVIMRHNNAIQYCYEKELKRNPDLKGKLVLRIIITPQGTVKSVQIISSTLNNKRVERCVVSRIRRWSDFGAIKPSLGDTAIRQTYTFGY